MKNKIILVLLCHFQCSLIFSQDFIFKGNNLFGLEYFLADSSQIATKLLFYDLDSDGDMDAITFGLKSVDFSGELSYDKFKYFISVQENIGDKRQPMFAPRKPFMDNFPFPDGPFFPVIGDLNYDGKPDFIVSSGVDSYLNLHTLYYERKSLTGDDQFNIIWSDSLQLNKFLAGSLFIPELADFDKDGDLDLLMSGYQLVLDSTGTELEQPIFMYAKNIGSTLQPEFLGWYQNPYGLLNYTSTNHFITSGDIDNDNDIDLITLSVVDTFKMISVIKNSILPNGKPNFNSISLMSGIPIAGDNEIYSPPTLADLDGDGDLDLFIVQNLVNNGLGIGYYENNSCVSISANVNMNTCTSQPVTIGDQVFTQSGQYTVNLKTTRGCDSIINLNLTVHPEGSINLTQSLCAGDIFIIGSQQFTQSGQYEVKLKTVHGCDSIVYAILTFVELNNSVSQSQNVLAAFLNGVQYQWFNCADGIDISGATSQSFQPVVTGSYGVRLTDSNGCKRESDCFDVVISDIEEVNIAQKITIYPNPSGNFVTIKNESGLKIKSVSFTDQLGRMVLKISDAQYENIDVSGLNNGNYMIEIKADQFKVNHKLTILK